MTDAEHGREARHTNGVVVIAAHPDDELLGCGGTLALHADQGDTVTAIIVCEGVSLRYGDRSIDMASQVAAAAKTIGIEDVRQLGFPDQKLDTSSLVEIIGPIEDVIREVRPRVVYCQYGGDLNRDHQLVFQAALVATRPTETFIDAVYAFDTASSTEWAYPRSFAPDTWVDITTTLERKLEAMACYESELREYPHPRSLEALRRKAEAAGVQCCLAAAETFMTIRKVTRGGETPP